MRISLILIMALALFSCGEQAPKTVEKANQASEKRTPTIDDLRGLIGMWTDSVRTDSSVFHEIWESTDDGLMKGIGCFLTGGDTIDIEHLSITQVSDEFLYNVRTGNAAQEAVSFLLMPSGKDTLKFYNNVHDFPQEIIYVKQGKDWHVVVRNDRGRELDFHLKASLADEPS